MKTIVINKNDANQRIDKFLIKYLKQMPKSLIYKCIRKKRIKVNNRKCEISYILSEGDILNLYINDEFFLNSSHNLEFLQASINLNILYEDKNILIIDKPPELVAHPDENYKIDCLINRIKKYLYIKNEYDINNNLTFSPALVNRIDKNTGGIVIAAKNFETLKILNNKIKNHQIKKYYLCKVHGIMSKKSDTLTAYIIKNDKLNISQISFTEKVGYKNIITKYTVLNENYNESLLKIELITGRKHQIRAHLSALGHPIVGDKKYKLNLYNNSKKYNYQALYSYKIEFDCFDKSEFLNYLNNKIFYVNKIWFLEDANYAKFLKEDLKFF